MQCPNCFAQIPDGSTSCGFCGSQFYNQMQYNSEYSNQQNYYNQDTNQEYSNYQGAGDMNQYNQYDANAQALNYNQYNQYDANAQAQSYNQYNQNVASQPAYGYDNNLYGQPATPYQAAAAPQPPKSGNSKNKIAIIPIISIVVIALIIGLVLILGGKKDKDKDSGKTTEAITTTEATTEATTTEATTEATTTEEPTTEATTEATTTEEPTTEAVVTTDGYNGKYVLTHFDENGQVVPVEDVENYSGTSVTMTMMIYNDTCLLDSTEMDGGGKVYCDFAITDGAVTLDDGYSVIEGTYDEEAQTISMLYNSTNMIFTLDPGDGTTYDMAGDYTLASGSAGGVEYSLEELRENMGDPSYDMTLKVYGVLCTLTSFEDGSIKIASTYLEAVGTDLYFQDGTGALMGKYNPEDQTIIMYLDGLDLTFVLDTEE